MLSANEKRRTGCTPDAAAGLPPLEWAVSTLDYSNSITVCAACGSEDLGDGLYGPLANEYVIFCRACGAHGDSEMLEVLHVSRG
jgi:hypothetical protein